MAFEPEANLAGEQTHGVCFSVMGNVSRFLRLCESSTGSLLADVAKPAFSRAYGGR